jgi:hypothetical protein
MTPDSVALLIAGAVGCFIGSLVTSAVMSTLAARMAQRAEKEAWEAASLFHSHRPEINRRRL